MTQAKDVPQDDIERMRSIVAEHDRMTIVKEFDINKPPTEPYTYRPFPRMVYKVGSAATPEELLKKRQEGWMEATFPAADPDAPPFPKVIYRAATVASEEDLEQAKKEGWQEAPPKPPTPPKPHGDAHLHDERYAGLDPASAAEAAEIDRKLKKGK